MELKRFVVAAAIVVTSSSCGSSKPATTGPSVAVPPTLVLWRMAPADTVGGAVIGDGSLTTIRQWTAEFIRIADARPETKPIGDEFRAEMKNAPFDPMNDASLASAGIDITKGAAVFVNANEEISVILPVADRKAFAGVFGAATTTEGGIEVESFEGGKLRCKMFETRYVCGSNPERLAMIGVAPSNRMAETAAGLAAPLQGDAQVLADVANPQIASELKGLDRYLSNPGIMAMSATMERGKLTVRGHLPGTLVGDGQKLAAAPSSLVGKVGAERPAGFLRARLDPTVVPVDDGQLIPGVSSADIVQSLTGEMIAFAHAGTTGSASIQLGLTKPDTFRQLLQMGCDAAGSFMPFLSLKSEGSACRGSLDMNGVPADVRRVFSQSKADVGIDVQADRLDARVSMGQPGPLTNAPSPSELGADLLSGGWNVSVWGEGLSPIYAFDVINRATAQQMGRDQLNMVLWLMGHVYEAGGGIGFRSDGVHAMFQVSSFAAAEDAEYSGYEAALIKLLDGDANGAKSALEALAKTHSSGIVSRQVGLRGAAWLGALAGGLAILTGQRGSSSMSSSAAASPAPSTP